MPPNRENTSAQIHRSPWYDADFPSLAPHAGFCVSVPLALRERNAPEPPKTHWWSVQEVRSAGLLSPIIGSDLQVPRGQLSGSRRWALRSCARECQPRSGRDDDFSG
jgi:hypothetical protein